MFKSIFSKYMIAFIIIILIAFIMLSGIVTSMIRNYATEEKETQLASTSSAIAFYIEESDVEQLESYVSAGVASGIITPLIVRDAEIDILVVSNDGSVLLSTLGVEVDENGIRTPNILGELGSVNVSVFEKAEISGGKTAYFHRGTLSGLLDERSIVCAESIDTFGEIRGYVISLYSTVNEDAVIKATRQAVINSSVWVMLAAVIAVYFITEKIMNPLRNMTAAVKKFGKGDFDTRVTVYGKDEIAELSVAFNNMADSIANLEKMRNTFLASVSHDLRTPMTTIAGFIDGIMSGAIPPEKQEDYLQLISSEIHRLSRLVSQILDVSRLESGDRKMNFVEFDVAEVARIILISFESKIEEKNLDVAFETDEDEVLVLADKDAIHQVLYNLCHNAIKFADDGGKFIISISSYDAKNIKISVFDEGQSISKEDLPMVFERFYKTDSSRGLDKTGVGLGLYICKTIIEAHAQEIHVESEDGKGTEFWFTLKKSKSGRGLLSGER